MKNITKENVEELIDKLADKSPKEGCQKFGDDCGKKDGNGRWLCEYCRRWNGQDRMINDPVMIGDVLEKIYDAADSDILTLHALWNNCGSRKSLQQIVKESGWRYKCSCHSEEFKDMATECSDRSKVLNSSEANDLFEFLIQIFND